ncbi:alpha beta hydrolase [Leptolyngbya sp. Heron Island J]|uniref:alpha/beta hydrolase n=1 Tax=Leptolyngbya sp. Heron Island J TaxID=1385935 RepID=UPI0003B9B83F|nr:alpha/beta hydrolase [Leptolyngbya sp. Heron Island J]ESA33137.1 alpha beta hydrolase [Leptolyngbya sp. Heron Island J]
MRTDTLALALSPPNRPAVKNLAAGLVTGIILGISCLFGGVAQAADIVNIQFLDLRASLPVSDLEDFVADGTLSPELQEFLEQTPIPVEALPVLLDTAIPDTGIPLGDSDIQFLLYQLNKIVGNPSVRANLAPLAQALNSAYLDNNMSMLELIKRYPADEVRFDIRKLGIVYRDVDLFVERLTPLFNFFSELLPDLVCECDATDVAYTDATYADATYTDAAHCNLSEQARTKALTALADRPRASEPGNISQLISQETRDRTTTQPRHPVEVTTTLGPILVSISTDELATLVETGDLPPSWPLYMKIAGLDKEDLRQILTSEFELDLLSLDQFLNQLPGEYALFQLGRIIHTPSRQGNIQALRGAILLSAADDNKGSLLEILQKYPARALFVDLATLSRLGRALNARGGVGTATASIEDLLVDIQAAIAADICNCEPPQTEEAFHGIPGHQAVNRHDVS